MLRFERRGFLAAALAETGVGELRSDGDRGRPPELEVAAADDCAAGVEIDGGTRWPVDDLLVLCDAVVVVSAGGLRPGVVAVAGFRTGVDMMNGSHGGLQSDGSAMVILDQAEDKDAVRWR